MTLVTAISIVLPPAGQALAVPLLRRHTPDTGRRMPAHLTILFPFVPPDELDAGITTLGALCANIVPFELTLSGYGAFPGVAYLQPQPSAPLDALTQQVWAAFPQCVPYEGQLARDEIRPHVTVAVFESAEHQQETHLPEYAPFTFRVAALTVSMGFQDATLEVPFVVQAVVPLGG